MDSSPSEASARRVLDASRERTLLCCILALGGAVYLRCLQNSFVLDDTVMVLRNPDIRQWSFLWKAFTRNEFWYSDAAFVQVQQYRNYRPLLLVWYWIDYHLFGLHPAPWHASIVAMNLVAVWLVFRIARRLTEDSVSALLAAALFALTPIHVAAVVWLAAAGMVLGTVLMLAAFYFILRSPKIEVRNWTLAIAFYAMALLCHESFTVFPAIVACYAILLVAGDEESWRGRTRLAILWASPFAAEVAVYFLMRRMALGFLLGNPYDLQNYLTGTQALLTVPWVLAVYLAMLAAPWLTLPIHPVLPVSSILSPDFWLPLSALAVAAAAFLILTMRAERRQTWLLCAAWIGIAMIPMLALRSMPHLVQDYCLYLPSVAWSWLLGDALARLAHVRLLNKRLVFAATAVMLAVFALTLWRVQWFWHDDVAAAKGYVLGFPESVRWRWALAARLDEYGDSAGSENEIRAALALEPDRTGIIHPHSDQLHHFLGELLFRRGDLEGAKAEIAQSVGDPPDADLSDPGEAPHPYDHAAEVLYQRGLDDASRGQTAQAIREVSSALQMMKQTPVPDYEPLVLKYIKLAELYYAAGDQQRVDAELEEMDSMSEGEVAVGLARATILLDRSDKTGAEAILRGLLKQYPTNYQTLLLLGDLEFSRGNYKEALDCYQRAHGGWFGGADLHLSIARSFHGLGRDREAADNCDLAQTFRPKDWSLKFACAKIRSDQPGTQ